MHSAEWEKEAFLVAAGELIERPLVERFLSCRGDPGLLDTLLEAARACRAMGKGSNITVSRNVFIPLTNLCRDRCSYCTFAKAPDSPEARTLSLEEIRTLSRAGLAMKCREALFCLGDKPEIAYSSYRVWLEEKGHDSTASYLVEACREAFQEGMLPHTNAGILSSDEMKVLRPWNASMGLMLETTSQRLRKKGMPHYYAPDKDPSLRIRMHEEAGELKIPFTSGILLGIGETEAERLDTLYQLREIQERYGHLQEVIVQPFHPKPGTAMRAMPSLGHREILTWVALARLILGPEINLQVPPNLTANESSLGDFLDAGINDWGGISPLTVDLINPEFPWPEYKKLQKVTEAKGLRLRDRLPVYPEFILHRKDFFDSAVYAQVEKCSDDEGYSISPVFSSKEVAA